jgi:hypothetical protein
MAQFGQGGLVTIACINKATVDLGLPLDLLTHTLQKAYDRDFLPVWGYPVRLYVTDTPRLSDWQFLYLDTADEAGALGYHDLTAYGQPISKVFVKTTLHAGELVSATASHELFEMVIDPTAQLWAEDPRNGVEYAYEMSDAVEEDTYLVDGVPISNFVHPSWFESFTHPAGTKFDHMGRLTSPFSMTKGGYLITRKNGKIRNVFGSRAKAARFSREDRRMHRSEYRVIKEQMRRRRRV